jgi:NADPH:quinone reductase-like Zn-dependent oxidoreductase
MRAVQITRFGGPEVMDVVELPNPVPGDGELLFDISSSGVNFAELTRSRTPTWHHRSCP